MSDKWLPDFDPREDGANQVVEAKNPNLTVCFIATGMDREEHDARTYLIAAAPELLEAAWQVIEVLNTSSGSDYVGVRIKLKEILAAAINKAEGRTVSA